MSYQPATMQRRPKGLQPPAYWYGVSALVLVVGVAVGGWQMKRSVSKVGDGVGGQGANQAVRGQGIVRLDKAGPHSVYIFRASSQRMDRAAERAWESARTARVTVREDGSGKQLAVKNVYETIDMQNNLMGRLVEFQVPKPGSYRVEISPSLEAVKPSVGPSVPVEKFGQEVVGLVVGVLIGLAIAGGACLAAFVIFLVVIIRRSKYKREMASYPYAGSTY